MLHAVLGILSCAVPVAPEGLSARDADGEPLDAHSGVAEGDFQVGMRDEGVRSPVPVDLLYTTASATLEGEAASNAFGYSVSDAGDVNGDGYDDVIVGANGTFDGHVQTGRAYVYLGSASGFSTAADTTLPALDSWCRFGGSVSGAGDVNGDGYDDVIVGARGYSSNAGRVYVYLGSASGVSNAPATTLTGEDAHDYFGGSVSAAGDLNGDGYDDVIVGADRHGGSTGRAYVYLGSTDGTLETVDRVLDGESSADHFGASVSAAGDVNDDGYADVIVGAYGYDASVGRAYVYLGSPDGTAAAAVATLDGETGSMDFGAAVSDAGDVDGDGYDDVIIGAWGAGIYPGRAYIYSGSSGGISSGPDATLEGDGATFGFSVSGAGDLDGDGYADVAVGAYVTGAAYVYSGSSAGVSGMVTTSLVGVGSDDFGFSVSGAGDVDGDGFHDLIVGAYASSSVAGRAYLYQGTADSDSDGYASPVDCDDTNPAVHPEADELCNGVDDNCDGLVDEDAVDMFTFYVDADGDGSGDPDSASILACPVDGGMAPEGYTWDNLDCDDANVAVGPGTSEMCDGIDNDCNGLIDETGLILTRYYQDTDGDGYGTWAAVVYACDAPLGYAATFTDCDDGDATINPGAPEICDGLDDDCDGLTDDSSSVDQPTWYLDEDGDGYAGSTPTVACTEPAGALADSTDCDDANSAVNPGAAEICDPLDVDEDCDGLSDDSDPSATGQSPFHQDADGDGYGGDSLGLFCDPLAGYVSDVADCDDGDGAIHPGAAEISGDGVDQDCDGSETCYVDSDGDGYRPDGAATFVSLDGDCGDPGEALASALTGDCRDNDPAFHPGAPEPDCSDPADYNCDGSTRYANVDGDAFAACQDCNDADPAVFPGAVERGGDLVDQDCDGLEICFLDADGDGYRPDATSTVVGPDIACDGAGEAVATDGTGDCDDADPAVHPAAAEVPGDGVDQDCDGGEWCLVDADGDGYTADDAGVVASEDLACVGPGEASAAAPAGDCDDGSALVNPVAEEVCNGVDDDCEGTIDEGAADAVWWYEDADGDGFTDPNVRVAACEAPAGFAVRTVDDCDDSDPAIHPGAEDPAGDGIDQDCGGNSSWPTTDSGSFQGGGGLACASGPAGATTGGWLFGLAAIGARRRRSLTGLRARAGASER